MKRWARERTALLRSADWDTSPAASASMKEPRRISKRAWQSIGCWPIRLESLRYLALWASQHNTRAIERERRRYVRRAWRCTVLWAMETASDGRWKVSDLSHACKAISCEQQPTMTTALPITAKRSTR